MDVFPAGGQSCLTKDGLRPEHAWKPWKRSPLSTASAVFYERKCSGCGSEQTRRADYVPGAAS